jgi:hypothetical protein
MTLIRDVLRVMRLPLQRNLRCVIRARVADLIVGWGHRGTNRRRANGRASPVTKESETRFNLARHRFDSRLDYCGINRRHTL